MKTLLLIILWVIAMTFATYGTSLCLSSGIIGFICLPINITILYYFTKWINALSKNENKNKD